MTADNENNSTHHNSATNNFGGFTTPDKYFTSVADDFFTRLTESTLPETSGHHVPNNYFDTLEDTIIAKLDVPHKPPKVISLRRRILQFIPAAAAASVLLFVGINYFSGPITINDISATEIEAWYENGYGDVDNSDFVNIFDTTDFEEEDLLTINIDDNELENYLNTIDDSILLNEEIQ